MIRIRSRCQSLISTSHTNIMGRKAYAVPNRSNWTERASMPNAAGYGHGLMITSSWKFRGVTNRSITGYRPKCTTMAWNTDWSRAHSIWRGLLLDRESTRTFCECDERVSQWLSSAPAGKSAMLGHRVKQNESSLLGQIRNCRDVV